MRPPRHPALFAFAAALFIALMLPYERTDELSRLKSYCIELQGKSFYFQLRNRVRNLEEYFEFLENLMMRQVYNPGKWPLTLEYAKEWSEEVKSQAQEDKRKCELALKLR